MVGRLFLAVQRGCLRFVIVVFPDHTHLLFVVASCRNLDMREVLKHPSGPLLVSLSNCDYTLKKTNKSTIARNIERRVAPAESIPLPSVCIIDGMSLANKIHGDNRTFGDIAKSNYIHYM